MNKKNQIVFLGRKIGLTFTEILIVVVIMGVLVTMAFPMLIKTIEQAKVDEAIANLNLIRTGQKIYFLEGSTFSPTIEDLYVENPNDMAEGFYDYSMVSSSTSDFTARASRKDNAPSPYKDFYYDISKDGTITPYEE